MKNGRPYLIAFAVVAIVVLLFFVNKWTAPTPIDDPIGAAVILLEAADIPVPAFPIKLETKLPPGASPGNEGWVYLGDTTIHIPVTTETWQRAKEGHEDAIMKLASILVHEGVHASGNPNEVVAYDAQIATLKELHAPYYLIEGAELSKFTITGK